MLGRLSDPRPGETCRVQMFRPLTDSPEEALSAARRMVEAHQLEWIALDSLQRENRIKRWWILADVCNPAPVPSGAEHATEAML